MKILVTGGAGFIGCHFLRYMIERYKTYTFYNLDALTYAGDLRNIADFMGQPNHIFFHGNICDSVVVNEIMARGVDAVVNLAAESHVDRSIANAHSFINTNISGTYTLLDAARKSGIKRFVQVSTDEVYGSLGEAGRFCETSQLKPNNPYAASKTSADLFAMSFYKTYGLPVCITRSSNNFGPYQHPEKLIPKSITHALQDKPISVYGDGQHIRDWLYVLDHCRAIDLVLHKGNVAEVYNIGGSQEHKNIDLVKLILQILGKPFSLIQLTGDRLGHDRRYAINSSKAQSALGWHPEHSFEDSLYQTVEWYLQNPERWEI